MSRGKASPVVVTYAPGRAPQPPVGEFVCDSPGCIYNHGTGEAALLWHARRYGHNRFSPR